MSLYYYTHWGAHTSPHTVSACSGVSVVWDRCICIHCNPLWTKHLQKKNVIKCTYNGVYRGGLSIWQPNNLRSDLTAFWQTPLSYLSSIGLGFALSYTPAVAMVGKYFSEKKTLAYGIALSGRDIFNYLSCFIVILPYFPIIFSYFPLVCFCKFLCLCFISSSLGSGIGTFILAPAVQVLIEHYSWRGALLILGGFVSNLCVCGALMRPLEPRGEEV